MRVAVVACDPEPDGWPLVAQTDDGNAWETGRCWLYCRQDGVQVLWLGPVRTPGADGHLYACGPCIAELTHMIRQELHRRDRNVRVLRPAAAFVRVPPHVARCRHRSLDGRVGEKFCEECGEQIYL
jgi:hypothetical protein